MESNLVARIDDFDQQSRIVAPIIIANWVDLKLYQTVKKHLQESEKYVVRRALHYSVPATSNPISLPLDQISKNILNIRGSEAIRKAQILAEQHCYNIALLEARGRGISRSLGLRLFGYELLK